MPEGMICSCGEGQQPVKRRIQTPELWRTYGGGKGLLLMRSIFKLWILLDSCANLASVCSSALSSSSSSPSVAILTAETQPQTQTSPSL